MVLTRPIDFSTLGTIYMSEFYMNKNNFKAIYSLKSVTAGRMLVSICRHSLTIKYSNDYIAYSSFSRRSALKYD